MIFGLAEWQFWLILASVLLYFMIIAGLVLGRAGVNPLWVMLPTGLLLWPVLAPISGQVLVPLILAGLVWRFAYMPWPRALTGTLPPNGESSSS